MIRVLVVDDSSLARDMIKDFLLSDGSFEIAGEASNGQEAVEKAALLDLDLITMDLLMPIMNGQEATRLIHERSNTPIVIVSVVDTAVLAYETARSGALDFISKNDFAENANDRTKLRVLETLKGLARSRSAAGTATSGEENQLFGAVVIAASTGGPKAYSELLSTLPDDFALPIIAVQHNSSGFDKGFVEWLGRQTKLLVRIAVDGEKPLGGTIYFAPTDTHLMIKNGELKLLDSKPVNNQKPSADVLFQSAAKAYKNALIGVVLTGMGYDGAAGCAHIREQGGVVIAQDKASSLIYGMPKAVADNGSAHFVLPLEAISRRICELIGAAYSHTHKTWIDKIINEIGIETGIVLNEQQIEEVKHFFAMKYSTNNLSTIPLQLLAQEDISRLAQLFTIKETYFFRESGHFELLLNDVLPELAKTGREIAICSAACSIGCEAYSIAAVIDHFNKTTSMPIKYHIDAFDIDQEAIEIASQGHFSNNRFRNDGSNLKYLLEPFIGVQKDSFTIEPSLGKHISFFTHNIMNGLQDDSYDIIFYRNAFLYQSVMARNKILDYAASALRDRGMLFVGFAENALVNHKLLHPKRTNNTYYFLKLEAAHLPANSHNSAITSTPAIQAVQTPIDPKIVQNMVATGGCKDGSSNDLAAHALLQMGYDLKSVNSYLHDLESIDDSAATDFLRGEYYLCKNMIGEARVCYESAAYKNSDFWPAFYRLATFSDSNNDPQTKHRVTAALSSIDRGQYSGFEVFIGGFSPEDYRYALQSKLEGVLSVQPTENLNQSTAN
ncbi:hypothetical protein AGMMS50229_00250 [Campylobacterota bacterium]|nr:hypothetical protein AGMMS50229_00250 [Campylobacterota bacterium]